MLLIVIVINLFLLFLLYLYIISPAELPANSDARLWQNSYAHRGLHQKNKSIPENSMTAFTKAVEAGYGIELDINLTADRKVVVFHDASLLRVCGVDKLITECTKEELSAYRLEKTSEAIPLLEDVLKLVDGKVPLIIELKNTRNWQELCVKAADLLNDYSGPYCIESFHPGIVRWFYKNKPKVVRGQLSANHRNFEGVPRWQSLLISSIMTNAVARPHFVAYNHEDARQRLSLRFFHLLGGKLAGWTVRDTDNTEDCRNRFDVIIFEFFRP